MSIESEIGRIGTWQGWAGEPASWPVTARGRDVVAWSVSTLAALFGDDWLLAATHALEHPLLDLSRDWPLSNVRATVRVIQRALQVALVPPAAQDSLRAQAGQRGQANFDHLALVLETVGLAARDGWQIMLERPTSAGRLPDLTLARDGGHVAIEVTRLAADRELREYSRWCDRLGAIIAGARLHHNVHIGGAATEQALSSLDLVAVERTLAAAADRVSGSGRAETLRIDGLTLSICPDGSDIATSGFSYPLLAGELWRRVQIRLQEKANQTSGGPPTWIRVDDVGGLFWLTDQAQRPAADLLHVIRTNIAFGLEGASHVEGVVLSPGVMAGHAAEFTHVLTSKAAAPSLALRRDLPGDCTRTTFVVPLAPAEAHPRPVDLGRWYSEEGSWTDWALSALGHPPLDEIIRSSYS